ncbi:MAG: LamG-like jellyroll fold domain-containing protein [Gammaproteobacteria bacterium]
MSRLQRCLSLLILALAVGHAHASLYSSQVIADDPLGYWRFEETAGTTLADSSGNGYSGSWYGAALQSGAGIDGNALRFNGIDQYALVDDDPAFRFDGQSVTVEAWVQVADNSDQYRSYVTVGGRHAASPVNYNDAVWLGKARAGSDAGALRWDSYQGTTNILTDSYSGALGWTGDSAPRDEWIHLVGVIDLASQQQSFYINGDVQETLPIYSLDVSTAQYFAVALGAFMNSAGDYFAFHNSLMDEVAIYDYALSGEQIGNHYAVATGAAMVSAPPLQGWLWAGALILVWRGRGRC